MAKRPLTHRYGCLSAGFLAAGLALMAAVGPAQGATAIKIGRTNAANVSQLPLYVAMETGLFRQEGLDARFVTMTERALVTAGLGGSVDFVPLARAGAHAALRGAPVRFVVGQSIFPTTAFIARPEIGSVAQLKDRVLGFGQLGQAGYRDAETVLRDWFGLVQGEDYRAVAIPGDRDRFAALERGDIQAGLFSLGQAAKAQAQGFRRLWNTGIFLPRVTGAVWTRDTYLRTNQDIVRRFIRAVVKATDIIHTDGTTTVAVIQKYLPLHRWEEGKALWLDVRNIYTADIPAPLLRNLFADRHRRLELKGSWPKNKPAPNPEYYIARALLTRTLSRTGIAFETSDVSVRMR